MYSNGKSWISAGTLFSLTHAIKTNNFIRSKDGLTLYAVSSDGTMAVFHFDASEMEGIAPQSAQDQYLKRFGFTAPPLPEGYSHQGSIEPEARPNNTNRITPPPSPRAQSQDFGSASNAAPGGERVHTLVAKRKPKKRIQPTFGGSISSSVPSSSINGINAIPSSKPPQSTSGPARGFQDVPISVPTTSALPLSVSQPFGTSSSGFGLGLSMGGDGDFSMDVDDGEVRISSFDTAAQSGKGKRRAGSDADERVKPRTLGGDRVREAVPVRPIASRIAAAPPAGAWAEGSGLAGRLAPPQLVTYLKAGMEGSDVLFEGRNSEGDGEYAAAITPPSLTYPVFQSPTR